MEAKIPWATLGGTPENSNEIGFDIMVNDDDDGTGRDAKPSWNAPKDQAWQDVSFFDTVLLTTSNAIPATPLLIEEKGGILIFPNPVSETLKLDGMANEFNY